MTRVDPAVALAGHIAVPGDKSISHRALLVGAVSEGETVVRGFGGAGDTESTLGALRALGVRVDDEDADTLRVQGVGLRGLRAPVEPIDCGNAGTLMRLLAGLLAGQMGRFVLTGDESLRGRPMDRVAEPLRRMGAHVELDPLTVEGGSLTAIDYKLPVPSAQVKSAVLLAGINAKGRTTVVEETPTRDHTELMLAAAGAKILRRPTSVSVGRVERLELGDVDVPGDFSSAAPFLVGAALLPGSELTVHGLGLNPTRIGLLDVLERMGARISLYNRGVSGGEPIADIEVEHADLVATQVEPAEVPNLIDELPLFALAASMARGESRVRGAGELRAKETDRIETVTNALRALGVRITASDDGFRVRGVPSRPKGGGVESSGDHRIAILGAVAGLVSREGVQIKGAEAVSISFPGFFELLAQVAQR